MKITLPPAQQLKHWTIFALGLAAAGYAAYQGIVQDAHATTSAIVAAVLLGVERYVSDPSTGNVAPTPQATAQNP